MQRLQPSALALVLAACVTAPAPPPVATPPRAPAGADVLGETPFSGDPERILDAMRRRPPIGDAPVEVLLEQSRLTFQEDGTYAYRFRRIYRVLTPAGAGGWSMLQAVWAPWRQARPALDARVITATGRTYRLDQDSIGEGPAAESGPNMLTDSRKLQAPLPAIDVGSIVEETIVTPENRPPLGVGIGGRYFLGDRVPVRRTHLVLDAPESLPLRWKVLGRDDVPVARSVGGRQIVELDLGPSAPLPPEEPLAPADVVQWPYLEWSTGKDWRALARAYADVVERQIADPGLQALVDESLAGAKDRKTRIDRLLAKVQSLVRYTGLEFGAAAVVPRTPAEILARHYGDCKDKAALLVAMLRAAGIDANVALLSAGRGPDVDPGLPNLSLFDHALVHVPGRPELWIDPTYEFFPAGEVPPPDQGRWALVAAPKTDRLVRIPVAPPTASRVHRERVLRMGELGRSQLELVFRYEGAIAADLRKGFGGVPPADFREGLGGYVSDRFKAERIDAFEHTALSDLTQPLEIRITAADVARGFTDGRTAGVALQRLQLLDWLPDLITDRLDAKEPDLGKRRHPLQLWVPYSSEIRYVVHPPPGYRLTALPDAQAFSAGPARFESRFARLDDGTIEVLFRFDTGHGRFTPDELQNLYAELRRLQESEPVTFELRLEALDEISAGRVREGLDSVERLIATHPDPALHRAQRALLLLDLGFGHDAREEARAAVAADGDNAFAWSVLGRTLDHDTFGRLRAAGWDREGAIAAWRRAAELEPDEAEHTRKLALALEHGTSGRRFDVPAGALHEAAEAWGRVKREVENADFDDEILNALFRAGDFAGVVATAESLKGGEDVDALGLAAVAAKDGPAAARELAARRHFGRAARAEALRTAAGRLAEVRHYEAAHALLEAGLAQLPDASALPVVQMLSKVRPHEELPPLEPHLEIVRQLMRLIVLPEARKLEALRGLLAEDLSVDGDDELREAFGTVDGLLAAEVTPDVVLDFVLSSLELTAEGSDESGWKIDARLANGTQTAGFSLFVVREGDAHRIAGTPETPMPLARRAFRLAEAGDLEGARRWLDWLREEMGTVRTQDPAAAPAFPDLWRKGDTSQDLAAARVAAASLMLGPADVKRASEVLEAARRDADTEARRTTLDRALTQAAGFTEAWERLLVLSGRLAEAYPESPAVLGMKGQALLELGRLDEAAQLMQARLSDSPHDEVAVNLLSAAEVRRGDVTAAAAALRRLADAGRGDASVLNNLAWMLLVAGGDLDEATRIAERAANLSGRRSRYTLHTLASIYAEAGRPADAWRTFQDLIALSPDGQPGPEDWYVYGRIAQSYGLWAEAERAYQRVPEAEAADATWHLVARARTQMAETRREERSK